MSFDYNEYNNINKPIPTIRDEDDNLLSITSSNVSYTDESQFVEIDNKKFTYDLNTDSIDFEFKEFVVAEITVQDKIESMFNLYSEVKESINISGNTNSHLYLFNSSKEYIGKQNLIAVDGNEYSSLVVDKENLTNKLKVCEELKKAENLSRDKKLTALYSTVNSIKNGAINVIDSTLLPMVGDNLQFEYALNSLKSIIAQPIGYLVDNKNELTVEKRNIKGDDQRYDITYNYLSNPNYFNNIFKELLSNPDLSTHLSTISTLKARISELENLLNSIDTVDDTVDNTDVDNTDVDNTDVDNTDVDNTDVDNTDVDELISIYNNMYNRLINIANYNISNTEIMKNSAATSTRMIDELRDNNNDVIDYLTGLSNSYSNSPHNQKYISVRTRGLGFLTGFVDGINEYNKQVSAGKKAYATAMNVATKQWKEFLENNGRL